MDSNLDLDIGLEGPNEKYLRDEQARRHPTLAQRIMDAQLVKERAKIITDVMNGIPTEMPPHLSVDLDKARRIEADENEDSWKREVARRTIFIEERRLAILAAHQSAATSPASEDPPVPKAKTSKKGKKTKSKTAKDPNIPPVMADTDSHDKTMTTMTERLASAHAEIESLRDQLAAAQDQINALNTGIALDFDACIDNHNIATLRMENERLKTQLNEKPNAGEEDGVRQALHKELTAAKVTNLAYEKRVAQLKAEHEALQQAHERLKAEHEKYLQYDAELK